MQLNTVSESFNTDTISSMSRSRALTSTARAPFNRTVRAVCKAQFDGHTLTAEQDICSIGILNVAHLSNCIHAVLRPKDLKQDDTKYINMHYRVINAIISSVDLREDIAVHCRLKEDRGTWLMRFSQPILRRPAAAKMMAEKSSFSSSFFRRVLRLPL